MSQELVSIIMPAFNAQNYIAQSIESVLKQTYQNWELLIADNNSIDNTAKIIKDYAKKDKRIKYIDAFTEQSAAYARNQSIDQAKGRFIAFLDSDDLWLPEKLEIQISFMLKHKYALTYHSYKTFGNKKRTVIAPKTVNYTQLLRYNSIGCLTVMYDCNFFDSKLHMSNVKNSEDWLLWLKILRKTNSVAVGIPQILAEYRITPDSVSANKFKCALNHYHALRNNLELNLSQSIYYMCYYTIVNILKRIL